VSPQSPRPCTASLPPATGIIQSATSQPPGSLPDQPRLCPLEEKNQRPVYQSQGTGTSILARNLLTKALIRENPTTRNPTVSPPPPTTNLKGQTRISTSPRSTNTQLAPVTCARYRAASSNPRPSQDAVPRLTLQET
jgi:hypothetical protein